MVVLYVVATYPDMKFGMQATKKEEKSFVSFQKGEEKAFAFFFNEYYACLSFFAFKILKDDAAAQDVVSDSFVKLWERREKIDKPESIRSYLYTTVKNACIDLLRSKNKVRRYEEETLAGPHEWEQTILNKLIEAEVLRHLVAARAKLPDKTKRVFEMFYFENKSYQQIAEEMNISIHTAKNQKIRAIKILRKQFPYIVLFLYLLEQNRG